MQFRIGSSVYTISFSKKGKDWRFSIRKTKLEPIVMGITSALDNGDIYTNQKHIGIFDWDDRLLLNDLVILLRNVQLKFKDFVGDAYIYETSPKKYSVHFYNSASYWDWLKVIHFCRETLDPSYVRWRLMRPNMVMRFTPKSEGHIPKLIGIVRTQYKKYEDLNFKNKVLNLLNFETKIKNERC